MFRGGGAGGGGGRFLRMPPSRWSGGGGGRHHPYRGPQDHRAGGGPGFRTGPGGFGGGFRDNNGDGGNFAKLFIGAVPRTATEEEIRPLFEEHGNVIEVAFIKDRRTGQQQSCCFIKYTTVEDAERAIRALHNQYTLPGGTGPIQVRYADGERERLGAFQYKLFVASVNKQATEKEIEEIFSPYGRVEDVYILRDEMKQNRGCCFVKLENREMAAAAITALNGIYVMSGCDQPLIVRFADPKKPRLGELRGGPTFGGPGFRPRSQGTLTPRSTPNHTEPLDEDMPYNISHPSSPYSFGPSSQIDTTGAPADPTKTPSSSQQVHQLEQLESPLSVGIPVFSQGLQPQGGKLSDSHSSIQQNAPAQNPLSIQEQGVSATAPISSISQQPLQSPLQLSPSPLTQSQWNGRPPSATNTPCSAPASASLSVSSIVTVPLATHLTFRIPCNWSEHICPDGFKYYYNCITRESRWEKPEEYAVYKQQQQKLQQQQQKISAIQPISPPQTHMLSHTQSTQASQLQQAHSQVQSVQ